MSDAASTGNTAFVNASEEVKTLATKPSTDSLLELYALFKQSIFGDNTTTKPGMFDISGKAKWEAWNGKKGMTKEAAQAAYIALVESLKA
ncbi:acyl-CoA-binding protein (ACBP)/diazepam binding inhibitor (DBI)/endozepine (EP) [Basidiobolus ranarum]|uniref:Acyl-CoA-binding protein (ACBP)/diazepam binding inhibitor (DBI)/endozepine (EP) n=1 Tax=Basidiobolus ranarum TaxID=34480 RepID=A0ABR2WTN6_9FUNG